VGYQKDTPAAVVFQVSHILKDHKGKTSKEDVEHWKAKVISTTIVLKQLTINTIQIIGSKTNEYSSNLSFKTTYPKYEIFLYFIN